MLITDIGRFNLGSISFEGSNGIVARIERLLNATPRLTVTERDRLIDQFVRDVLQNA